MAVRKISYLLTVPQAFPSMNAAPEPLMTNPVIINVDDSYDANAGDFDFAADISETFEEKTAMLLCHESQVLEWSAFQDGREKPYTEAEFREKLVQRHQWLNERYGQDDRVPREYFRVTRWGKRVPLEELKGVLFAKP